MGKHLIIRIVLGIVGFLLLVSVGVFSTYKITSLKEQTSTSGNPNSTTVSPIGTTLQGGSTSSVINHGVCNFTIEPIICDGNLTLTEQTHGFYVEIQNRLSHLNSQYSDFTIRSFEEQNMMFLDSFKPGTDIRHGITIETMGSLTNYTNTINNCLDIAQKYQAHATRDMGNIWYENVNRQVKVSNAIYDTIDLYVQIKSKVIHSQTRRGKIISGMNGCLHVLLNQTYICFEDFTFYETNEMLSQVLDILETQNLHTEIGEVIHADSGERGTNTTRLLRRRAALGIHHHTLTSEDALRQPNTTDMKVKESATIIGDNSEVSGSLQVSVLPQPTHRIRHWRKKVRRQLNKK